MQLNKIYKIKLAIMSFISVYLTASLYVPALNIFRVIFQGENMNLPMSKIITSTAPTDKEFFNALRNYMRPEGKMAFIEIFWYAMMVMFVVTFVMLIGVVLAWLLKKDRKLGFKIMYTCAVLYLIALIVSSIVAAILMLSKGSIDSLDFVLIFNVPMMFINVILSIVYLATGVLTFKHYRLPKLSEQLAQDN